MTSRAVLTLPILAGSAAESILPLLARALDGGGPALQPVPARAAGEPSRPAGTLRAGEDDPDDPTAIVISTSGSTGEPKQALLPVSALRASAAATHARLAGPGAWLLALPAHHVAGLQVLLRSVQAGTAPVIMERRDSFSPNAFEAATTDLTARATGLPTYTSLVPTQLTRLLDAGGAAVEALRRYDRVLVGGAATAPAVIERARAAGVGIVTTYGMSETCGGCVYDGEPLAGVRWRDGGDGRIELGGAVLARGYRGRPGHPAFVVDADGSRWFRTDDLGEAGPDGALRILGRHDDVIVSGGLKVAPALVEAALADQPGVAEVVVVGVADHEWGERVVAVVRPGVQGPPTLAQLRRRVAERVSPYAAPRQLLVVDAVPLIGPGKPDRAALRALAQARATVTGATAADGVTP